MGKNNKKTILVVEDNELSMRLFTDLLEYNGYKVLRAEDGGEGVDIARECNPNLILMDIRLPKLSGYSAIEEIKKIKQLQNTPIVAVTAFAMSGDEARIRKLGVDAYLSKPVPVDLFLETVERFAEAI
ncbi:MAG: response regulator [Parvibaculales bacterium]